MFNGVQRVSGPAKGAQKSTKEEMFKRGIVQGKKSFRNSAQLPLGDAFGHSLICVEPQPACFVTDHARQGGEPQFSSQLYPPRLKAHVSILFGMRPSSAILKRRQSHGSLLHNVALHNDKTTFLLTRMRNRLDQQEDKKLIFIVSVCVEGKEQTFKNRRGNPSSSIW